MKISSALAFLAFLAPAASAAPPNVVFVLADDLGYTDLACYGSKYYETPNIDRLASQGMKFTDGYSCGPNCQPTRAALMSGQYGARTGVYTVGSIDRFDWRSRPLRPVDNVTSLPRGKVTFAQALKPAGYATGLFGKWHLGEQGDAHPARRGFDEAIVSMGQHFKFTTNPRVDYPPDMYLGDFLTEKAVDFIRRHKDEPFLLCLHHFEVHSPFDAKKDLIARFKNKPPAGGHHDPTYAAMIATVDDSVGAVMKVLDELGLSKNTLVIFTSDNGGVGGYAREGLNSAGITDNAPLRGGKGMLYEGGVRVPYIFRWPGTIPAGQTSGRPINSVDLYATLLDLAGAKRPEGTVLDGSSYLGVLKGGKTLESPPSPLYWHFPGYLGAAAGKYRTTPAGSIRDGDWKLIEFFETGKQELYNLREDVGEQNDLAAKHPAQASALHDKLAAWRAAVKAPMPTPNQDQKSTPLAAKKKGARKKAQVIDDRD